MEYEIGTDESLSTAVALAVGAVEGCDPCSLRPLNEVVDTDALDRLFKPRSNGLARVGGCLSFVYSHSEVSIHNGEFMTVEPLDPSPVFVPEDDGPGPSHP